MEDVEEIAQLLKHKVDISDRSYRFRTYRNCFLGKDAVQVLIDSSVAENEEEALVVGNLLLENGYIQHVTRDHPLKNEYLFYEFIQDGQHGGVASKGDGSKISWADFLLRPARYQEREGMQPKLPEFDTENALDTLEELQVFPLDDHNLRLLDMVHPPAWQNPKPSGRYNLVVIGAGTGGLVSAAGAAGVGGKVALIERDLMGGDCLNVGCVPSKALLRAARAVHEVKNAGRFGVEVGTVNVDFNEVMRRMRQIRAAISPNDSAPRFSQKLGVDVYLGHAKFTGPNTVEVAGQTLEFSSAVIATGGRPKVPPIPGLQNVSYLTNTTVFNLTKLPASLAVIGAGPIGLELAQAFCRFGSQVMVFSRSGRLLQKEEEAAQQILKTQMESDGVDFHLGSKVEAVGKDEATGGLKVHVSQAGKAWECIVEQVLVATGRAPNVEGLGLDEAHVKYDTRQGIKVNDRLQTSNKSIYAVGDCCTGYKFTHVADFMARLVIRNALFFGSGKMSSLLIPWVTYTDPEIAHVGLYESDLEARGIKYTVYEKQLADVDRAVVDGDSNGYVRILVKKGGDQILGATVVAADAGNIISEVSVAMQAGMGLGSLAYVIHPYPTVAEAVRQCGDLYNKSRITPTVRALFRRLLATRR